MKLLMSPITNNKFKSERKQKVKQGNKKLNKVPNDCEEKQEPCKQA